MSRISEHILSFQIRCNTLIIIQELNTFGFGNYGYIQTNIIFKLKFKYIFKTTIYWLANIQDLKMYIHRMYINNFLICPNQTELMKTTFITQLTFKKYVDVDILKKKNELVINAYQRNFLALQINFFFKFNFDVHDNFFQFN